MADILDQAIEEATGGSTAPVESQETTAPVETNQTTAPVETEETTAPVETEETTAPVETEETTAPVETEETTAPVEFNLDQLSEENSLKVFNKLTGLNLESLEGVKDLASVYGKLPEHKKHIELFPKLVEQLKQSKNVLSHFPDETAYKVSQLVLQNEDYKGKESVLTTIMKSDFSKLSDVQILKLHADLAAPSRVMNPLRSEIARMGLDPDEVINNYDNLSDDDKDTITMAAHKASKEMSTLGSGIETPETVDDVLSEIEAETIAARDDLAARKEKIDPISDSIVNELKEITVSDDFNFVVQLNDNEKGELSSILTETLMTEDIDLSTPQGKQEIWDVLNDAVWLSQREKILKSWENDIRTKAEEDARIKYNNEKPLDRKEPQKVDGGKDQPSDPLVSLIEGMVEERK